MKKTKDLPKILILICIGSLIFLFANLPEIKWIALIIFILFGVIIITGLFSVENNPPHIALITFLGQKIWKNNKPVIVSEGLNWIFLKGIIYNVIPINVELKQKEFSPQQILGTDNIDVKVPISYAYNVEEEESHIYINVGKDDGVEESIKKKLEGRLREYSRHPEEGPMTWKEMIASGLKTLDYLTKGLCQSEGMSIEDYHGLPDSEKRKADEALTLILNDNYDHLLKISSRIPTPILLDWYREKDPPNDIVRKQWGDGKTAEEEKKENEEKEKKKEKKVIPSLEDKWRKLEDEIEKLAGVKSKETSEEAIKVNEKKVKDFKGELNTRIKNRIELLEKLQLGKAKVKIPNLGIYLIRLTIGDVNPFGEIYLAEIALQREEGERKSETYEVETDLAKAVVLKDAIKEIHETDADIIECFNAIMKWKMIGSGKGFIYDGQLGNFAGLGDLISSIMKGGKK